MKSRTGLREAILRMHGFGDTQRKIAEALRIPQSTVNDAIQRGTIEDKKGRGRPRTARTPANMRKIKGRIQRNPSSRKNSTRKMAAAMGTSKDTVHRILRKDLKMKSRKEANAQNLEDRKIRLRAERCPR
jgi:IS30 family transposase